MWDLPHEEEVALLRADFDSRWHEAALAGRPEAAQPSLAAPAPSRAGPPDGARPAGTREGFPTGLTALAAPEARPADKLGVGGSLSTGAGERRRVALPDGSTLLVNEHTALVLEGQRHVRLLRGEVFCEVARHGAGGPDGNAFMVQTPDRRVTALGTRFRVRHGDDGTGVLVAQGKVRVSGLDEPLSAGQQLLPGLQAGQAPAVLPAPRASFSLDWTRGLLADARPRLVPPSEYSGGALVAKDPAGRESRLGLRKYHVDVHIEDGFARTTIDQTYFNHETHRLEGTFFFPLPPDASLSRLAMYVGGRLMEGGMAERQHAREVFETIVRKMQDPALLEWIDGSTFRMRVFPLEPRQEKRIVLSYTQRLPSLYGRAEYRFPAGHSLGEVGRWSSHVVVKGGAGAAWRSESHPFHAAQRGGDLVLDASAERVKLDRDIVVVLDEDQAAPEPRFSSAMHEGRQYLMLRWRPDLPREAAPARRDWVFLFEASADRNPLVARVQADVVRGILENAGADDTFQVLTAGTRVRAMADKPQPAAPGNAAAAMRFLDHAQLIGALDLEKAFSEAARAAEGLQNPVIVHLGAAIPVLGERDAGALVARLPQRACYVGVGVGRQWNRALMKAAAARTGGSFTQINPDENVAWRALDLAATLNTPRLLDVRVVDRAEKARFLVWSDWLAHGEELCAVARLDASQPLPKEIEITGTLGGKLFVRRLAVRDVAPQADYLPRTWAKLEIDRLVADGAEKHRAEIVALSKAMYVMSPFTSLLVLENEEMYRQYNVDGGRKDHWALYPCPETIPVVEEPLAGQGSGPRFPGKPAPGKRTPEEVLATVLARTPPRLLLWHWGAAGRAEGRAPVSVAYGLDPWWPDVLDADNDGALVPRSTCLHRAVQQVLWDWETRRLSGVILLSDGVADDPSQFQALVAAVKDTYMEEVVGVDQENYLRRKRMLLERRMSLEGFHLGTRVYPVADLVLPLPTGRQVNGAADFDSLIDLITSTVRPTTWWEPGLSRAETRAFHDRRVTGVDDSDDILMVRRPDYTNGTSNTLMLREYSHWDYPLAPQGSLFVERYSPFIAYPDAAIWQSLTARRNEWHWGMDLPGHGMAERRIADALRQPTTLEFIETPLQEVIDYLKDLHGIEIQVDKKALEDVGMGTGTPITKHLKGISLRSALRLVLRELDLTYVVWDDVLLITTPEEAEAHLASGTLSPQADRRGWLETDPFARRLRYWDPRSNRDRSVFTDLAAYAPGVNTTRADLLAVLETEADLPGADVPGHVDPRARRLIEGARRAEWRRATLRDAAEKTLLEVDFDGTGRYRFERLTRHGLREQVACDGRQLWHLYPELGLGARRDVGRFHREELCAMLPWVLPPAGDLAQGADVVLVDEHTVAVVPHRAAAQASPLPLGEGQGVRAAGSGAQDERALTPGPSPEGRGEMVRLHLVFGPDGRLAGRRLVRMPSGETLLGETYAPDGTVTLRGADGKLLRERKIDLAPCPLPDLRPDVRDLVVLPMPLRDRWHLAARGLDLAKGCAAWSEDDALAVAASCAAAKDPGLLKVVGERFFAKGDRRLGFYTLLLSALETWDTEKDVELGGVRVRMDPLADHPDAPLARYVAAWAAPARGGEQGPIGPIGGPEEGFLQQMVRVHSFVAECRRAAASGASAPPALPQPGEKPQPEPDRAEILRRGPELVRACKSPELAWTVVAAMAECAEVDAQRRAVADAASCLEDSPLRFAALYRRGVSLDDEVERRGVVAKLIAETAGAGLCPPIEGNLRHWLLYGAQGGDARWPDLVRAASGKLIAAGARDTAVALACDLHRAGDPALAEEVLAAALRGAPEDEAPGLALLSVRYYWHTGQRDQAQAALKRLLEDDALKDLPWLWALAGQAAEKRGDAAGAVRYRERALELAYADPPRDLPVEVLRADHRRMIDRFAELSAALSATGAEAPPEFLGRIVAVADRWRSLDPEPQGPCLAAAGILARLGQADLAWDYATTPLAGKTDGPPRWGNLGAALRQEGLFELADRAYALAVAAEPANAELVWDRALVLLYLGRNDDSQALFRRLAEGDWAPGHEAVQRRARERVEKQ